ncbi:MAG: hypothetical protein Q8R28_06005 [Dehalococcoidia bacterium]|nr:hypothetical protein [Dehalococcoidia bacterium]
MGLTGPRHAPYSSSAGAINTQRFEMLTGVACHLPQRRTALQNHANRDRIIAADGSLMDDIRYHAFAATRSGGTNTPTDKRFTTRGNAEAAGGKRPQTHLPARWDFDTLKE